MEWEVQGWAKEQCDLYPNIEEFIPLLLLLHRVSLEKSSYLRNSPYFMETYIFHVASLL